MAEVVYSTIFQFKRGQSAAWTRVNPILEPGEPGFELDTGKLKIGDGSTNWNDLKYFGGEANLSVDGKSLVLSGSNLELYGFSAASAGQIPSKGTTGSLEWIDKDIPITE